MRSTGQETQANRERFHVTNRVRALADAAAQRGKNPAPCLREENQTRAYFELYRALAFRERQARSLAYALINEPVHVFPGERVNGIFYGHHGDPQLRHPDWGTHAAYNAADKRVAQEVPEFGALTNQWPSGAPVPGQASFLISDGGYPGHVAWNYSLILAEGVEGLMARHRQALEQTVDADAKEYYAGVLTCWTAVLESNRRHIAELRKMAEHTQSAAERSFVKENIGVMERVPRNPARTFREAIQSFYFQWLCVMYEVPYGGNSPGRLDYFLWPYLREEFESGELSYQDAGELVAELFIKMDERVHPRDGHVNTIVVGGVGPDGTDAVNPLSYIMLDVFEALNLTHPAVYTRISDVNPPDYVDRCTEYMLTGGNRAQILSDEAIVRAMTRDDRMPFEDAAMYICGGCMEINPHGMNSDLMFSFLYNVPKTLELLITGGECLTTGQRNRVDTPMSLSDVGTFDEFYAIFENEMRRVLHTKFRCLDIYSEEMARCRPAFLQSSLIDDCLEKGRNQQDGGARYGDYGGTPLGIQNAADSLQAIKVAVFDEAWCSADELVGALRANFENHERLHRRLLSIPKYGVGDPGADSMMQRVLTSICGIFDSYRNRHGRYIKPIIFTFVWAPAMGRSLGASPDGRKAGRPIAHGLTPQAAGMAKGITASINSYASLPNDLVSGSGSTMWDMDSQWVNHDLLKSILRTFIRAGGHIFQGNTTDIKDLKAALDNPDGYPNLIVRVGGFSARFVQLSRPLQLEIIERYRHSA